MAHTKLISLSVLINNLLDSHKDDENFEYLVDALENTGNQEYIDDIIFETADGLCPVFYNELAQWISTHIEEINETAREYGVDADSFDLYKLAQQAWVVTEEGAMREYVEDACLVVALKHLAKTTPEISEEDLSALNEALENASPDTVGDIFYVVDTQVPSTNKETV